MIIRQGNPVRLASPVALVWLCFACGDAAQPTSELELAHAADAKNESVSASSAGATAAARMPASSGMPSGGAAGRTSQAASAEAAPPRAVSSGAAGASATPASSGGAGSSAAPMMSPSAMQAGAGAASMSSAGAAGLAVPAAGAGGGAAASKESLPDLGAGDGSDIVTIGDSWMNFLANGGGIEAALDRAGTKYAHYAVPGTLLLNGQIPSQYDQAKGEHSKISTVILTAGGNDIMAANGCDTKEKCATTVQGIIDGLDKLFMKMAQDRVTSTVYIVYSKAAGSGPKDTRPDVLPVPTICQTGKLRCLVVDTTDIVTTNDLVDGVHPTQPATDRIAKRTLDMMKEQGVRR